MPKLETFDEKLAHPIWEAVHLESQRSHTDRAMMKASFL